MDKDWRSLSACSKLKDDQIEKIFWIKPGKSATKARVFCSTCPVKQECYNYAIMYKERGIWAGTTEEERSRIDPWMGETLRARAAAAGQLESRNIADFLAPPVVIQSLTVDQEVESLVQSVELSEALDLLCFVTSDLLAS